MATAEILPKISLFSTFNNGFSTRYMLRTTKASTHTSSQVTENDGDGRTGGRQRRLHRTFGSTALPSIDNPPSNRNAQQKSKFAVAWAENRATMLPQLPRNESKWLHRAYTFEIEAKEPSEEGETVKENPPPSGKTQSSKQKSGSSGRKPLDSSKMKPAPPKDGRQKHETTMKPVPPKQNERSDYLMKPAPPKATSQKPPLLTRPVKSHTQPQARDRTQFNRPSAPAQVHRSKGKTAMVFRYQRQKLATQQPAGGQPPTKETVQRGPPPSMRQPHTRQQSGQSTTSSFNPYRHHRAPSNTSVRTVNSKVSRPAAEAHSRTLLSVRSRSNTSLWRNNSFLQSNSRSPSRSQKPTLTGLQMAIVQHINRIYNDPNSRKYRMKVFFERLEKVQKYVNERRREEIRKDLDRKEQSLLRQSTQLHKIRRQFNQERNTRYEKQYVSSKVFEYEKMNRSEFGLPDSLDQLQSRQSTIVQRKREIRAAPPSQPQSHELRERNVMKYGLLFDVKPGPHFDEYAYQQLMEPRPEAKADKTTLAEVEQLVEETRKLLQDIDEGLEAEDEP